MCNYKSALYFKNGDLVHSDATDSHEDLALVSGLKDSLLTLDRVARVECVPPSNIDDIADLSKWTLRLDENYAPNWWDKKRNDCERKMLAIVKNSIVTDERKILLGGCYVLAKTARVHKVVNCRILIAAGANLESADMVKVNLEGAVLTKANLASAYLFKADLANANLDDTNLEGAVLNGARLENAFLYNANLTNACMEDANLRYACLSKANLGGANLYNANLENANLEGARLRNANLNYAYRLKGDKPIEGWRKVSGRLRPYNP